MAKLDRLARTTSRKKKRVGRGYGSGKGGHTSGRGAKGLKARGKVGLIFAGTKTRKSLIKRLPLQRGKGKFKPLKPGPLVVNLKYLNFFKKGEKVSLETLIKKKIVAEDEARKYGVKILGDGKLEVALTVELPTSKGAAKKIVKAGGKVATVKKKAVSKTKKKSPKKSRKTVSKKQSKKKKIVKPRKDRSQKKAK